MRAGAWSGDHASDHLSFPNLEKFSFGMLVASNS